MTDMVKLNDQELENAVGGRTVTVQNSASPYTNLRAKAGLKSDVVLRLENGDLLETTGKKKQKDGYVWYQVYVIGGSQVRWSDNISCNPYRTELQL